MDLSTLRNTDGARRPRKRVGRGPGSGQGKTAGKGHKGQKARKGYSARAGFEGGQMALIRRVPKRGFHNHNRKVYLPVNVAALARFDEGTEITEELLRACGLANGNADGIKILGNGSLDKKLTVKVAKVSATARGKIEAAGGTCEGTSE